MDLTPEQIQQMITMLQSMLPNSSTKIEEQEEEDTEFVSTIKTKKVSSGKKSNFKNKFNDMPEKNMHKEDVLIDQKLNVSGPTPRRKNNSLTEAQCRVCGKKEVISAGLIMDKSRFKCNNCSSGAG